MDTADDINEIGDVRGSRCDRLVEGDRFALRDGSQPFQHLEVAAAGQTAVREQSWNLTGVRSLPVQRRGVRPGRVERADPRGRRAIGRAKRDRPVAGAAGGPPDREKRLFRVSVIGVLTQHAEHLKVRTRFL